MCAYKFNLLVTIILIVPINGVAGPIYGFGVYDSRGTGYALHVERYTTDLKTEDRLTETRISRLGLALHEAPYSWLHGGLFGGILSLTQSDNAATAGASLGGQYLGLWLGSDFFQRQHFRMQLRLDYSYNSADDKDSSRHIRMNWHDVRAGLGAEFHFEPLTLGAGTYYQWIDGDETVSGDMSSTREFSQDGKGGSYLDIRLQVDQTGSIGIRVEEGGRRGYSLIFGRSF